MKKVLLTGGTGFVGRKVFLNLLDKDVEIKVIVRKGKEDYFKKNESPRVELISTHDLFEENSDWWAEQCKNIDTVLHIAWYTEHGKYLQSLENINCMKGTLNLAEGSIKAGIRRFVGIGTCFEYDLSKGDLSINTPLKPLTIYAGAKASIFTFLSQLFPKASIEFSWCRLFYLYGEGEDERRFFSYLHNKILKNEIAELSDGHQVRDFMDIVDAAKMIVENTLSHQQGATNICSGIPITIREFAEKIANKYNRKHLLKFGAKSNNIIDPPRVVGVLK